MNKPMRLVLVFLCVGCAGSLDPNVQYIVEACEKYAAGIDKESRDRIELCESNPDVERCKTYLDQMALFKTVVRNELGLWKENALVDAFRALGITHPESMSEPIVEGITAKKTCDADVINHAIQETRKAIGVIEN